MSDDTLSCSTSSSSSLTAQSSLSESENFLLNEATLWIDMRFRKEVNMDKLNTLLAQAPGGAFESIHFEDKRGLEEALSVSSSERQQRRIYLGSSSPTIEDNDDAGQRFYLQHHGKELFSEDSFMTYVSANWVNPEEVRNEEDKNARTMILCKAIEQRGLLGLNEAMLEHHKLMSIVLQAITIHLEGWKEENEGRPAKVLMHCSFGKDRTGLLSMLCQHINGDVSEDQILHDYYLSRCIRPVALEKVKMYLGGKVDLSSYAECDKQTMRETLVYLRHKYGDVDGYLDAIGFDQFWRKRFVKVAE